MGQRGQMQWVDGRRYEGEFHEGKKHGEGQLSWPDGRSYAGQWEGGRQHGFGIAVTAKGLSRRSQWQHGNFIKWLEDAAAGTSEQRIWRGFSVGLSPVRLRRAPANCRKH